MRHPGVLPRSLQSWRAGLFKRPGLMLLHQDDIWHHSSGAFVKGIPWQVHKAARDYTLSDVGLLVQENSREQCLGTN